MIGVNTIDREEFMSIVYDELHSDGDNNRANRIIDAADGYAESTQLPPTSEDTISRRPLIDKLESWLKVDGYSEGELNMLRAVLCEIKDAPPLQPERGW